MVRSPSDSAAHQAERIATRYSAFPQAPKEPLTKRDISMWFVMMTSSRWAIDPSEWCHEYERENHRNGMLMTNYDVMMTNHAPLLYLSHRAPPYRRAETRAPVATQRSQTYTSLSPEPIIALMTSSYYTWWRHSLGVVLYAYLSCGASCFGKPICNGNVLLQRRIDLIFPAVLFGALFNPFQEKKIEGILMNGPKKHA